MPQPTPADDSDLKQWFAEIKAEGGLPDDQMQQLETILGADKVKTVLKRSVSNHKDWTKKTMEVAEQRKQVEADRAALEQQKQQNEQWREQVQGQIDDAYKQFQESNITAAKYQAIIKSVAGRYGIPEDQLLGGEVPPEPPKGTKVADVDTSKFLTKEDLEKQFSGLKSMDALVQAELLDLNAEHQELFGKPLRGHRELVNEAIKSNRSIRELWQEKHGVQAKRDEIRETQIRKDERDKADAEWRGKVSEQTVNGQRSFLPEMPKSAAYEKLMGDAKPPKPNGSDRSMERVNRAAAAWTDTLSGKA